MKSPNTYSEWVNLLESFAEGDDTSINILESGSFIIDAGTAARFYTRVEEAYKKRKKRWLDNFQKSFELSGIKRIEELEISIRTGKQNLLPLCRFVNLTGLPDDLKQMLGKDLSDFVAEIKNTLKNNVSRLNNDRDRMMIMLSSFDLPVIIPENSANSTKVKVIPETEQGSGRKILF